LIVKEESPDVDQSKEVKAEFFAMGNRLVGRINGVLLPPATDDALSEGTVALQCKHLIKDIEVVNLDDVPEMKALKMAGIDRNGNDVRKGKGPSGAAVAAGPSATPLKWNAVDLSTIVAPDEGKKVRRLEGAVLHVEGPPFNFGARDSSDYAIRLVLDWKEETKSITARLRSAEGASSNVRFAKEAAVLAEEETKGVSKDLQRVTFDKPLEAGAEVVLEAAVIGPAIYGRINGLFIGKADTKIVQKGNTALMGKMWIKRIEVVHLDGVSDPLTKLGWDVSARAPRAGTVAAP
jgi:hypothetical protein